MVVDRTRLPPFGPTPAFRFPAIVRHTLANGLDVRTVEHPRAPVVAMCVLVRGGLGADPAGQEGLAALTADLLDEGTGDMSAIDVSDALARIGGDYDVHVGADSTVLSLVTLSRLAEKGGRLLASLALTPALRDDDFARIRRQRLDRLAQLRSHPHALAESVFERLLYGSHPYGHLSIGSTTSLSTLTPEHVRTFHAAAFRPDQATLVLSGALSHQALRDLAERCFGGWTSKGTAQIQWASQIAPQERSELRRAIVPREGAAQSELRIGHLSARRDTPDYSALLVMNAVLGGQFASRVNLKLREEKGFTYGASTGFDWRRGMGPFSFDASVHTAATAEALADSVAELDGIRGAKPPTEDEMVLAKASLVRGYPRGFETAEQVAGAVASLALHGLPDTYFAEFSPKIEAITDADVVRVAQQYIDPARLTMLVVGDHAVIGPSLDGLGWGDWSLQPAEL